jgi:PhoH-like ATPase
LVQKKKNWVRVWEGAIKDNLEFLIDKSCSDAKRDEKIDYLFSTGQKEIDSLTYIRSRSLPQHDIIIDDVQNLTPYEIKTIASCTGHGVLR